MPLGQVLVDNNLLDASQLEEARSHQKVAGGSLIESLLSLGLVDPGELESFLGQAPYTAESAADTGLTAKFLLSFILKSMYVTGHETIPDLVEFTKLSPGAIDDVLEDAKGKRLVEVMGLADTNRSVYRYALTDEGRRWATNALDECSYAGPAPVTFEAWQQQILKQSIGRDRTTPESIEKALAHLVLPDPTVRRLGPASNAARAILLYGAVGNGKTSIAEALARAYQQEIFIPYCVEIDGQIIKVYDSAVHHATHLEPAQDERWVHCRRPAVITGGELTIEMLDLSYDLVTKTYEAPAHIKATGGVFILDDFGRQRVEPLALLNRWMIPLERGVDFLTLHTGKKLKVHFDELIVFSTNTPPTQMIDEAGLRRIPYKLFIEAPTQEEYSEIFRRLCAAHKLELPDEVPQYLLEEFYPETKIEISGAHPRFLLEHILERCQFEDREPVVDVRHVFDAAHSLVVESTPPKPRSL